MCRNMAEIVSKCESLRVGEEYPFTIDRGTVTVVRQGVTEYVVTVSLESCPAFPQWEKSETVDNPVSAAAMVGAL